MINSLENGLTLHIMDEFKPRTCLKYIGKHKINMLILVPAMVKMFCVVGNAKSSYNLHSVRIPLVGAGPITEEIYQNFFDDFGVKLLSNFGSSETGCIISRTSDDNIKSVGKAMYSVELKVCDEDGHRVPNGTEGQLFVKWKGMLIGYFEKKVQLDEEGFFAATAAADPDEEPAHIRVLSQGFN